MLVVRLAGLVPAGNKPERLPRDKPRAVKDLPAHLCMLPERLASVDCSGDTAEVSAVPLRPLCMCVHCGDEDPLNDAPQRGCGHAESLWAPLPPHSLCPRS
jgi:hypothetical protein